MTIIKPSDWKLYIPSLERNQRTNNPINAPYYQRLLHLSPVLSTEIKKRIESVLFLDVREIKKEELSRNETLPEQSEIDFAKQDLLSELTLLEHLTGNKQPIKIIMDDCFTNLFLVIQLREILGKEAFDKYVKIIRINYQEPEDSLLLKCEFNQNDSVFIFWWSLSDTHSIDESYYKGMLFEFLRKNIDLYESQKSNQKILGVCFGQQFIANVLGISHTNDSWIIWTLKGPLQLTPSNCSTINLNHIPPKYRELLMWLTNDLPTNTFSTAFTRSWYVTFDLLNSMHQLEIVPLIRDEMTQGIVWWGTKGGNVLWVQFHPEINLARNKNSLLRNLRNLPIEDIDLFLQNFEGLDFIERDIGESFYAFALDWFIKQINRNLIKDRLETCSLEDLSYENATRRLVQLTAMSVNQAINNFWKGKDVFWIREIDRKGKLQLNYILDWKVNRSLKEISEILGLESLSSIILKHKAVKGREGNYVIRDLWAWDGSTMKELYKELKGNDVIIYWIGDYLYFDLYWFIQDTPFMDKLPKELIVLFVEQVVYKYRDKKKEKWLDSSTIEMFFESVWEVKLNKELTIKNSSMTEEGITTMFEDDSKERELGEEITSRFGGFMDEIEGLKKYLIDNFYTLFSGFFQRIYLSKFNELDLEDQTLAKVDFQYAIRATSHVNWKEYKKILDDYVKYHKKKRSIYFDNGVHQSYTSIIRIPELNHIQEENKKAVNIRLLYDKKTNYFCSAVICDNEEDFELIKQELNEGVELVDLKEANDSTFIKIDYFLRNFILFNFKNNKVFWNFNKEINATIREIINCIKNKDLSRVPTVILNLINFIGLSYKNENWMKFDFILQNTLEAYTVNWQTLKEILDSEIYMPDWMDISVERKN